MILKLVLLTGLAGCGAVAVIVIHDHDKAPAQAPQPTVLRAPTAQERETLDSLQSVAPHPLRRMH